MKKRRSLSLFLTLIAWTTVTALVWPTADAPSDDAHGVLPALRQPGPRYWKGNLHTHSFWSDGDDFPEMIADWYKQQGYHFLALSDHNVLSEGERWLNVDPKSTKLATTIGKYAARFGEHWVERRTEKDKPQVRLKPLAEFRSLLEEPGRFLMIPGQEITHAYARMPVHVNAINLRDPITPLNGDNVSETIRVNQRAVSEQGRLARRRMIAFLNHPNFHWAIRAEDLVLTEELRYFEIFNGHPSVRNYGDETHPGCERMWDIVLALRLGKYRLPITYGLATDDAHDYHQIGIKEANPGRGWMMVKAPYLSAEAIIRAMEEGQYYCTTGVVLNDVTRKGNQLSISIQPKSNVRFRTQFIATLRDARLDSEPRKDDKGNTLPVTQMYADDIGKVVQEVEGLEPKYQFTGKELYVRAKIISDKPHPNPYQKGDVEVAWTQPMVP